MGSLAGKSTAIPTEVWTLRLGVLPSHIGYSVTPANICQTPAKWGPGILALQFTIMWTWASDLTFVSLHFLMIEWE